ncbi:D-inositol-3-phosphate glycosyltransferase [Dyadobacter sp. CECT 9623]|uniref:D-inositol-3-phosphate glycosyltransferase n=1 Tax=Dyadobacter linearis TaxID=2823330 RepID=A0ABM8UUC9_9BACT|nr:glycosyltransferase family 4 protein [Dyadobacter sp. CECT 9623]CAG5072004.1 D-inositol-3-phosphate glycosyltransferase [Dyadobacter sp. CECT 9623]
MNQKKRILIVHHSGNLGGAPRSLSFLLDKIDYLRYEVELLCIKRGPGLNLFRGRPLNLIINERIFPFHGSTVSGMHFKLFIKNLLYAPQSFLAARKLIKLRMPELVHLNSSSLFIVAMAAKSVSIKIKVVCHIREPLLRRSFAGWLIKTFCYLYVDEFIAIDKFAAASMKTRNNIKIVYNAVNFEEYNPDIKSKILRQELRLPAASIIFLYLARFSESNGTLQLIQMAKALSGKYNHFHFVLAGLKSGHSDGYTSRVVQSAFGNPHIHLMPFREDVPSIIASCDILVVPFTEPHFARSIVEAAAIGKPSIGSNLGGVNELIVNGETGFLYDTPDELQQYCEILGTDESLRLRMGTDAVLFAKRNFDNRISSALVFKTYDKLLTESV